MDFEHSPKVKDLAARLTRFMDDHVYPAEPVFAAEVEDNRKCGDPWVATKIMEDLKRKARAAGLWNLFLPESDLGAGLTNLEYAPLCEIMGRSWIAPEALTAMRPTRATWRCWCVTARTRRRSAGSSLSSRARSARR